MLPFTTRSEKCRAPAWSWASTDGEVACGDKSDTKSMRSYADVEAPNITFAVDEVGALTNGFLRVKGFLYKTYLLGGLVIQVSRSKAADRLRIPWGPDITRNPGRETELVYQGTSQFANSAPIPLEPDSGDSYFTLTWDDPKAESILSAPVFFI